MEVIEIDQYDCEVFLSKNIGNHQENHSQTHSFKIPKDNLMKNSNRIKTDNNP